jgi:predicted ATPase/class 3 adenylate cyclase
MNCPNCQHKNRDTAKFCENCGNRLQILCPNCDTVNRAGAKFCDNCGHELTEGVALPGKISPSSSPISKFIPKILAAKLESARSSRAMQGERRVVTILFCDVKGSTQSAEQLDPEEWTEIMNGAFEHMIRPVYEYEGTVARLMGDAVLAFFGAPLAHEDDPQRAVLAGLGIAAGIKDYRQQVENDWGIDIDVRVGINTGLVVVGAVGSDLRMEYTAMGDAINLAARMEQSALPGTVQIAQDTHQLVAPFFEFEDLGGVEVKGKAEPVQAYRVSGRTAAPGRQRGIPGVEAPLIGRADESSALEKSLADLDHGLGGIVYLLGEAGLGKSRLIREVKSGHTGRGGATWFETYSHSYESEQPYGLFRRLMRQVTGADQDESSPGIRSKIRTIVEDFPREERAQAERVFESLFGLPGEGGEPPLEGESFKGLLYTVMASYWQRRAQSEPVVLVCDDLHWTDPASVALLKHLYPLTNSDPLLLLCAMRPDQDSPGWEARKDAESEFSQRYREISLQPLNTNQSGQLVDSLLRISDLPVDLRRRIMEKSEGNPYFVEEVVRTLIDKGMVLQDERGSRWQAAGEGDELDIPGNLQTLLVARIDRLADDARQTLQLAAVVGRSFYHRLLQRLVEIGDEELEQHLLSLEHAQLILEAARVPELEYLFRHALMQEAAYSTILLKQRRVYHHQVGQALEALYPDRWEEMAGTLAEHYFQAREFANALHYYTLAGDAAFRLYATLEALEYYERAIQCTEKMAASSEQLLHLYNQRGRAFELDSQFDQALENYQQMSRLAEENGDEQLQLASLTAQCILRATQTPLYDPPQARKLGEAALALARQTEDQVVESRVLWGLLLVEVWSEGDIQQALEYGLRSLDLAGDLGLREQMGFTNTNLVNVYWNLNQLQAASQAILEAQAIWEELGNLPMLADAYTMRQFAALIDGKLGTVQEIAKQSLQLSQSIGNLWNQLTALHYMTIVYREQGKYQLALETIEKSSQLAQDTGVFRISSLALQLRICLTAGAMEEAEPLADQLYAQRDKIIPFYRPEVLAMIILVEIARGRLEQAQQVLEEAYQPIDLEDSPIIYTGFLILAEIHLLLAQRDPQGAIDRVGYLLETIQRVGFRQILPEALWLQGKCLLALDQLDQAHQTLEDALIASREIGERRVRWQILSAMVELETRRGKISQAQELNSEAGDIITYIADHSPDDLRVSFLAQPEVLEIIEKDFPPEATRKANS